MPYALSASTFSRQAKLLVQHWPFSRIQLSTAREILSQLYGYKNHHHYQQSLQSRAGLLNLNASTVLALYRVWVKRLADLGSMNQIQARQLLHILWPDYLASHSDLKQKLYQASFQFFGACRDFFDGMSEELDYDFDDRPAIKDAIEALGLPHPEVGGILVNATWVDFSYQLQHGDHFAVYPHPCPVPEFALPFKPGGRPVFLLDVHLGGLARYLRMAGFDCLYQNRDVGDAVLAEVAARHDFILLTRDLGLLKRSIVNYGHWVRAVESELQFKEVVDLYQLQTQFLPFSRCIKCNGSICTVPKSTVEAGLPEQVRDTIDEFSQCQSCRQVYWQGSHYQKIVDVLQKMA